MLKRSRKGEGSSRTKRTTEILKIPGWIRTTICTDTPSVVESRIVLLSSVFLTEVPSRLEVGIQINKYK